MVLYSHLLGHRTYCGGHAFQLVRVFLSVLAKGGQTTMLVILWDVLFPLLWFILFFVIPCLLRNNFGVPVYIRFQCFQKCLENTFWDTFLKMYYYTTLVCIVEYGYSRPFRKGTRNRCIGLLITQSVWNLLFITPNIRWSSATACDPTPKHLQNQRWGFKVFKASKTNEYNAQRPPNSISRR